MGDSPKEPQPKDELPQDVKSASPEIDPELIKLPRRKSTVRPISAVAIIAICLTLSFRLLSDLSFSRQGEQPTEVTSLDALGADLENQFIEIEARPDRPQALRIIPNGKTTGQVLMPVLGTAGKLWILIEASPWNEEVRTDERYRGRLMRLDDLGYDEAIRARIKTGLLVPRPIALSEIREALRSTSGEVHDASGDSFPVGPGTSLRYQEIAADTVRILAVSTDPYNDEAGWRLALQSAGILNENVGAVSSTTDSWTFDVKATGGLAEVNEKLVAARLFAASISEVTKTREGKWSDLSLDGEDILMGEARVGFVASNITLGLAPRIDANAYVLNTTEEPETYWYVPALVLMLAGLGFLFAFGLYRRMR
jgi:hypothetical protein